MPLDPDTVISLITDDFDRRQLKKHGKRDERDIAFYANGSDSSLRRYIYISIWVVTQLTSYIHMSSLPTTQKYCLYVVFGGCAINKKCKSHQ